MELFDLYNAHREPLGITMQRDTPQPPNTFRLVVKVCIFNQKGQLLCQHRLPTKTPYANLWDVSVGGSVIAGETSVQGALRETQEEIGVTLPDTIIPSMTFNFGHGFEDVFCITQNVDLSTCKLQPTEVDQVAYLDKEQILSMIDNGTFIPYAKEFVHLIFLRQHKRSIIMDRD